MITAGLTGGIASGKSLVTKIFREFGASIIDADEIAHQVISLYSPEHQEIIRLFGREILRGDGTIDRGRLGRIVFADPEKRALLESIVHPKVFAEMERQRTAIARKDARAVVICDIPLLIETWTEAQKFVDKVILVSLDKRTQAARLMKRDGLSRHEAEQKIAAQIPLKEKRRYADYIIDNRKTPQEVRAQIRALYRTLRELALIRRERGDRTVS